MASTGDVSIARLGRVAGVTAVWSAAVVITGHAALQAVNEGSNDFQWSGAHMLTLGQDPYLSFAQHGGAEFLASQFPNYLPLLYVMLLPLGFAAFQMASVVWVVANLGMLAASVLVIGRGVGLRGWGLAIATGLVFCAEPFAVMVRNGQQTGLVLFAAVLSLRVWGATTAGGALAVMLTKYSFAPLLLVQLLRGRWRSVVVAAGIELGALLIFCAITGSSLVRTMFAPLHVASQMARGAGDVMTLVRVLDLPADRLIAYLAAVVVGGLLAWYARGVITSGSWVEALACASLIALVTFPHLIYDYCFLLPVAACALRMTGWQRALILGAVSVVWYGWFLGGLVWQPYRLGGVLEVMVLVLAVLAVVVEDHKRRAREADLFAPVTTQGFASTSTHWG